MLRFKAPDGNSKGSFPVSFVLENSITAKKINPKNLPFHVSPRLLTRGLANQAYNLASIILKRYQPRRSRAKAWGSWPPPCRSLAGRRPRWVFLLASRWASHRATKHQRSKAPARRQLFPEAPLLPVGRVRALREHSERARETLGPRSPQFLWNAGK